MIFTTIGRFSAWIGEQRLLEMLFVCLLVELYKDDSKRLTVDEENMTSSAMFRSVVPIALIEDFIAFGRTSLFLD